MILVHPLLVRLTHWVNAIAMVCMVMSGWGIYDATPLFGFSFPRWATLGGWLGGSIAWHLAAMWLLVGNGLIYIGYGLISRHFQRSFLPLRPMDIWGDFIAALRFRLAHKTGVYNSVQRLLYIAVLLLGVMAVATGLMLWKPVQFQTLAGLVGGYEVARRLHFVAMSGIVGFTVVHLALVMLVPRTLPSMITGRAREHASETAS
ncbi:cytochrome b/b6 domain-containing protein [Acidisphaera sp. L21]|uniref:cytochrome b/b6 domain-containing protein n=1 Tax=Acidisphaera sp. L21 TaxID=1641851 RepID=UPI0020B13733|nr:cytochrome b/b6 domain-containing protein [Acidisphaera sp. L21]